MIQAILMILLWTAVAVFTISDLLCILALFYNRDNWRVMMLIGCVTLIFAAVAAAAAYGAMQLREMIP